jgi:sec-independent protein translocase protein TatB
VFGIGWEEFIVIALAFLIFLGPKEIPRVFNKLGRLMRDLNAASRELRNQLEIEVRDIPTPQKIADEISAEVAAAAAEPYEEARRLDAELKRDLGDLAAPDDPAALPPVATGGGTAGGDGAQADAAPPPGAGTGRDGG